MFAAEIRKTRTHKMVREYRGVCCTPLGKWFTKPPNAQGLPEEPRIYPV
jgi:hypothetical protein